MNIKYPEIFESWWNEREFFKLNMPDSFKEGLKEMMYEAFKLGDENGMSNLPDCDLDCQEEQPVDPSHNICYN